MAVLDILVNNADRKGGHILVDTEGHTWGIDHGVTFSPDPKLRTVLWGWADEPIDEHILGDIEGLASNVVGDIDSIDRWLQDDESVMLRRRISDLLLLRRFPTATDDWPAIPWPVF